MLGNEVKIFNIKEPSRPFYTKKSFWQALNDAVWATIGFLFIALVLSILLGTSIVDTIATKVIGG